MSFNLDNYEFEVNFLRRDQFSIIKILSNFLLKEPGEKLKITGLTNIYLKNLAVIYRSTMIECKIIILSNKLKLKKYKSNVSRSVFKKCFI